MPKFEIDSGELFNYLKNNSKQVLGKFALDRHIDKDGAFKVFCDGLLASSKKYCQVSKSALTLEDRIEGLSIVEESKWDSEYFNLKIGKTKFLGFNSNTALRDRASFLGILTKNLVSEHYDLLIVRVPIDDILTVTALEEMGAILTDVLVTFHKDLINTRLPNPKVSQVEVSEASMQDEDTLGKIARDVFKTDHFHADPFLPSHKSDELYAKWVMNSLHGEADAILVARKDTSILGFITCKSKSITQKYAYGQIDLVGVTEENRGKGIGTLLVLEALRWFLKRVPSVYVGTQAGNIGAMRLYTGLNFKPVNSEATMHKWIR